MATIPFDRHGILLRRDAVRAGFDDSWLSRMLRQQVLVRIRHGAYVDRSWWARLSATEKHVVLCRAVMQQYDDRVALSHASAHLLRGGPDWAIRPTSVHVTNLLHHGDRHQAGVVHHRGRVDVHGISRIDGHWITSPARTAIETAARLGTEAALCVLDWTLHQRHATSDQLLALADIHLREWPDTAALPIIVRRSSGLSESVGETRSRYLLEELGLNPEPQWEVLHPSGRIAGRVDLTLRRERLLVEFDGAVKYGRLLKPGQTLEDVIRAERAREVLLEELTGFRMLRLVWSDLDDPARVLARVRHAASHRQAS